MAIKDPAAFRDMGITVVILDRYGPNQQCDDLRQLASLLGTEARERSERYIEIFLQTGAMVAQSSVESGPEVACYMELSNGKAYTSKAEMFSLIGLAGGHNIVVDLVSDAASSTQLLSYEAVIAYRNGSGPAYIMVREGSMTGNATGELLYQMLMSRAGWRTLNATLNDDVHIITLSVIMSEPRVHIGLVYLCEPFHPGVLDTTTEDLRQEHSQLFGLKVLTIIGYQHISA
jgi:ABC-type Fe3+-hydroxamate transport system substrate-binding protein